MLVLAAFTLLGAAAASGPMFEAASRNAAMSSALASVPPTAQAADSPVVRIVQGSTLEAGSDPTQERTVRRLARIPGLTTPRVAGISIGSELLGRESGYGFAASTGARTAAVRLVAAPDPDRLLVPTATDATRGVWLSDRTASALGVRAGADVRLVLTRKKAAPVGVTVRVRGVFATVTGAALPADVRGSTYWSLLRGRLPTEPQATSVPAQIVVADVATIDRIARVTGDQMLWFVDAQLARGNDTLDSVGRTAAAIEARRAELLDPDTVLTGPSVLRPQVSSGVAILHTAAQEVADATVTRSSSMTAGAVLLALGSLVAVMVLGLQRRRVELRLTTTLGVKPLAVGAMALIEHLLLAVVGCAAGVLAAYAVVEAVGPPGQVPRAAVAQGTRNALVMGGLALALVGALTAAACLWLVRPTSGGVRRRVPWEALLVVAAVVAAAGLLTGPDDAGAPQGLALLVPLLVTAAIGAVGGRALLAALRLVLSRRRGVAATSGVPLTAQPRTQGRRRWVVRLALRRLAAPSGGRAAVVGILATGLALLLFALTAAVSTENVTADRAAVLAAAAGTADLAGSAVLDPSPPLLPETDPNAGPVPEGAAPSTAHDPPVGPGQTVVWRTRVGIGSQFGNVELLVVNPTTFDGAASWGSGHALSAARRAVASLRTADTQAATELTTVQGVDVPVIAVNAPRLPTGTHAQLETLGPDVNAVVIASVQAFPGLGTMPMVVAPSASLLGEFGSFDPRYANKRSILTSSYFTASLWSAKGPADIAATLDTRGTQAVRTSSELAARQQPELVAAARSLGYLRAVGLCMGLLAALAFALHADRSATRGRASDLLLASVGVGRQGVRAARLLETALMVVPALLLAVGSTLVLVPMAARLLDPQTGQQVKFVLRLDAASLALTAALAATGLLLACAAVLARLRSGTPEEVLRDAD